MTLLFSTDHSFQQLSLNPRGNKCILPNKLYLVYFCNCLENDFIKGFSPYTRGRSLKVVHWFSGQSFVCLLEVIQAI